MDVELSMIAERLQIRLPYLRADKNDRRTAHDFLIRIVADGRQCFQKWDGRSIRCNTKKQSKLAQRRTYYLFRGATQDHTRLTSPKQKQPS